MTAGIYERNMAGSALIGQLARTHPDFLERVSIVSKDNCDSCWLEGRVGRTSFTPLKFSILRENGICADHARDSTHCVDEALYCNRCCDLTHTIMNSDHVDREAEEGLSATELLERERLAPCVRRYNEIVRRPDGSYDDDLRCKMSFRPRGLCEDHHPDLEAGQRERTTVAAAAADARRLQGMMAVPDGVGGLRIAELTGDEDGDRIDDATADALRLIRTRSPAARGTSCTCIGIALAVTVVVAGILSAQLSISR